MNASLGYHLRGLTLFLWAGVLLGFAFSGRLAAYLHPTFRPFVPIAGCVVLVLALAYYLLWERGSNEGSVSGDACGHGNCCGQESRLTIGSILAFFIVALPVIVAKLVSPDEFSAVALKNRWSIQSSLPPRSASERRLLPQTGMDGAVVGEDWGNLNYLTYDEDGRILVEVIDLMFGIEDEGIRGELEGHEVTVIGQFMPAEANNARGNRFRLARMFMWCCAADSRPISIIVEGATDATPGQWVKVTGRAEFPVEGGSPIALIRAATVELTKTPGEPLLY